MINVYEIYILVLILAWWLHMIMTLGVNKEYFEKPTKHENRTRYDNLVHVPCV